MAKIGDTRQLDNVTFYLLKQGVTKAEAVRSANWQRRGGSSARIEKVARGDYKVWVGPSVGRAPWRR